MRKLAKLKMKAVNIEKRTKPIYLKTEKRETKYLCMSRGILLLLLSKLNKLMQSISYFVSIDSVSLLLIVFLFHPRDCWHHVDCKIGISNNICVFQMFVLFKSKTTSIHTWRVIKKIHQYCVLCSGHIFQFGQHVKCQKNSILDFSPFDAFTCNCDQFRIGMKYSILCHRVLKISSIFFSVQWNNNDTKCANISENVALLFVFHKIEW